MNGLWKKIKGMAGRISLVDRFLLLLMLILLCYTAVHLFTGTGAAGDPDMIDVIVRTSAAAIFGYFISSNFVKKEAPPTAQAADSRGVTVSSDAEAQQPEARMRNQIGFRSASDGPAAELGKASFTEAPAPAAGRGRMQVIVVSAVGIASLVLLLAAKNFADVNAGLAATVSQLRDFVSASVGFLISCGKNEV